MIASLEALFGLSDKTAIVTGGARGLGLAIARAFGRAGASVIIAGEDDAEGQKALALLRADESDAMWVRCDVTKEVEQATLVELAMARFGAIDILVANAGIAGASRGSAPFDPGDYRRVMAVNLDSVAQLCALVLPHMQASEGGSIILMASLAGLRGNRSLGAYALSKAALAQLARNLAVEFGSANIRANAIAPGLIRTDLAAPLLADPASMESRMRSTPLRRPGEPDEVAGAALFLASPAGAFITGQTLVIDGGTLITDAN